MDMLKAIGGIKMTTQIVALVIGSILASILAVSLSIYLNLHSQALADGRERQQANISIGVTILEKGIAGSQLKWTETGAIDGFQTWAIPSFEDDQLIQSITRVTRQDAAIYAFDQSSGTLVSKTTSLLDGEGKLGVGRQLDPVSAAVSMVLAGRPYTGLVNIDGAEFYAALQPIEAMDGTVLGAIFVGTPKERIEASANATLVLIGVVGSVVTTVLGLLGFVASHIITRPLPKLATATKAIAESHYATDVPFTDLGNEIGGMARAVEVFRQNGLRISQLTEAEADRIILHEQQRQQMMAELQSAFGQVVDAATSGDFTRRVTVDFPDAELNTLAASVNNLVTTFERNVSDVGAVLGAMASTDFTMQVEGDHQGAFAQLQEDVNAVSGRLTEVVRQLRHSSGLLKTATGEILAGANDLSERTTHQAAAIEETSAAMEQLLAMVLANSKRARDASQNAAQVLGTAEEGGQAMEAATQAMERITSSSSRISNIIGMIDDIAFQTNLLALNASVEAARAGEAGKGFAVVAVEVRRLAQSAAQASAEVKDQIVQSGVEVSTGSKLVTDAALKLSGVINSTRTTAESIEAIAHQSAEQATAIEQVTSAVRLMDEMTQHNAALVEQTNAAIEQTEGQAAVLDAMVGTFRIPEQQNARRPLPLSKIAARHSA